MLVLIWCVYLFTDVYGHVALKIASEQPKFWNVLFSFWGISTGVAWFISAIAWLLVLSKHSLLSANSISALTYVLIALAAVVIFKEQISPARVLGIICICVGIYLVHR